SWVDLATSALRGVDSTRAVASLDDAAIAQLEQVLEMTGSRDRLDQLVTPPGDRVRILCFVPRADYAKANRLLARLDSLAAHFPLPNGLRVRASGSLPVAAAVVRATVTNQVRSVGWAFVGLGLLLALSFGSIALAAAMLVPVAGTTVAVFGAMGYAAVPLGVATSMFAALAEGRSRGSREARRDRARRAIPVRAPGRGDVVAGGRRRAGRSPDHGRHRTFGARGRALVLDGCDADLHFQFHHSPAHARHRAQ